MHFLAMTLITIRGYMGHGGDLANLMPKGCVATRTFDLVVGDMFLMHDLRGILGAHNFWFAMTLDAFSLWYVTIPLNHTEVAFFTGHSSLNILTMIKIPSFDFYVPFGLDMARGTTPYGT